MNGIWYHQICLLFFISIIDQPVFVILLSVIDRQLSIAALIFFPSNAFLRRRRKKALLRVNDRGGGWRTCILALCRVCVCVCVSRCVYARAGTSAVNLRRYGNTPQTITIHDLVEILLLCAAHATVKFS